VPRCGVLGNQAFLEKPISYIGLANISIWTPTCHSHTACMLSEYSMTFVPQEFHSWMLTRTGRLLIPTDVGKNIDVVLRLMNEFSSMSG
jgi:hypothetical protein